MKNLSWKNFKANFWSYIPALLILGLGTALINIVLKIQERLDSQLHQNVAGIEALVGAKGSPIQLTLANIYHLDDPTGNIPLEKAEALRNNPMVDKAIPMAYGDNHKGYRLLGTNLDYLDLYHGKLEEGRHITKPLEVIVGHNVAKKLSIDIGYTFYSTHGSHNGHEHKENQYVVVGILEQSKNVLDNLIITSIASFWQTHQQSDLSNSFDSISFAKATVLNKNLKQHETHVHDEHCTHEHHEHEGHNHEAHDHEEHRQDTLENHSDTHANHDIDEHHLDEHEEEHPVSDGKEITALLLKFKGPAGFFLINQINSDPDLMAINPSQTVLKFLTLLGVGYSTIQAIAVGVIFVAVLTLMLTLIQVFSRRKHELALLRSMGASRSRLILSLLGEVVLISSFGFLFGMLIVYSTLEILPYFVGDNIFEGFDWSSLGLNEIGIFATCILCGMVSVLLPLYKVYRIDISKTLANES
jgi:putative ABC transport system permease protein